MCCVVVVSSDKLFVTSDTLFVSSDRLVVNAVAFLSMLLTNFCSLAIASVVSGALAAPELPRRSPFAPELPCLSSPDDWPSYPLRSLISILYIATIIAVVSTGPDTGGGGGGEYTVVGGDIGKSIGASAPLGGEGATAPLGGTAGDGTIEPLAGNRPIFDAEGPSKGILYVAPEAPELIVPF
jgi:hypothetical protein